MKYIIKESKLNNFITEYIDGLYDVDDIDWDYGRGADDDGFEDRDIENEDFLFFYTGDWEGEDGDNVIFNYFSKEYYSNDSSPFKDNAPILAIKDGDYDRFNTMFNDFWKEPMKQWFEKNFNLPVNTISND
jgi:hypothetical protein